MKKKINDGYFLDYLHDGKSISVWESMTKIGR